MLKCIHCGSDVELGSFSFSYKGIYFGHFEGEKCKSCGSLYFTEKGARDIEIEAKRRGVWGEGKRA